MADPSDLFTHVPDWLLRPMPTHASRDEKLEAALDVLGSLLPQRIAELEAALDRVVMFREYDSAANRAAAHVWRALDRFHLEGSPDERSALARFAGRHLFGRGRARILRRLAKDPDIGVRRMVQGEMESRMPDEVALPARLDGAWDATGWHYGTGLRSSEPRVNPFTSDPFLGAASSRLGRHSQGRRVQEANGLPVLGTVGELRQLLGIRSEAQLGFLLLGRVE